MHIPERLVRVRKLGSRGSPSDRRGADMSANERKVVARYADGRIVRGYTFDFSPSQPRFRVFEQPTGSGPSTQVLVRDLKAVFFVRDLVGNSARQAAQKFPSGATPRNQVEVRFLDGEAMLGTADSPTTDPLGFFLIPAAAESNNVRVYVVAAATRAIYRIEPTVRSKGRSSPAGGDRALLAAPAAPLLPGRLLSWLTR
jgi:hypothetical protein